MSRVGRREIKILEGVIVEITPNNEITTKGPLGTLKDAFSKDLKIIKKDDIITISCLKDIKTVRMLHGTTNALITNMILGVKEGFKKELKIIGVGYNVKMMGTSLEFSLGLSHKINLEVPSHLKAKIISPTELEITGISKQQVGEFAAKIKSFRKPEPYGGKGIRYKDEHISLKAGKTGAKK